MIDTGILLDCPLLVLNDTFHVAAYYQPPGFRDPLFMDTIKCGEITYEVGAIISQNTLLNTGSADYIKLNESDFPRRFTALNSSGVTLGYFVCVDTDGHLHNFSDTIWQFIERILSKQLFIEASRNNRPFETAEDILMHLLDGSFPSESYFQLRIINTYLADFHPTAFALIDLTAYHSLYFGKHHLKQELLMRFPDSHAFLYKGNVFLFLHSTQCIPSFFSLAKEFHLRVILSERIQNLYTLPKRYHTACRALQLMLDHRFNGNLVCSVAQLRTSLLLKELEDHMDLISADLHALCEYDKTKGTLYCETLYHYLTCGRSLKQTCAALFTHRNTVLYRIRKIQEDFSIPLDDPDMHTELLLGVSLLLFHIKGPGFFVQPLQNDI